MAVKWTEEQKKVITLRDRNILVSAAAGSGKTAVLVQRILSKIMDPLKPVDIDRLLIMTFTRAAAGEMLERIERGLDQALAEDPDNEHLQRQMTLIHTAQITTIDGFCAYVIRNYFHLIGLDPGYRTADEGELKLLQEDVLKELFEDHYAERKADFTAFVECYAPGKTDEGLKEHVLELYNAAMSNPWPEKWLDSCVENYHLDPEKGLEGTRWFRYLWEAADCALKEAEELTETAMKTCQLQDGPELYLEALEKDMILIRQLKQLSVKRDYDEIAQNLRNLKFARLSSKKMEGVSEQLKNLVKALREDAKDNLKELGIRYFYGNLAELTELTEASAPPLEMLVKLTKDFAERFQAKKREKNVLDFSDMEHFALDILLKKEGETYVPSQAARELSEKYDEVLLDEYQDSNLVQEILMQTVSGWVNERKNIFMVGDVKQSIYRFRLSRPELFLEKFYTYNIEESQTQRIDLHRNFRSRKEVLESANAIFRQIMTEKLGGIVYDEQAALYPGAEYPETENLKTEILLMDSDLDEYQKTDGDTSKGIVSERELEARMIAMRIRELLRSQKVVDKETGELRNVRYSDIVILTRSVKGFADVFTEVLNREGIPAYAGTSEGYFQTQEVGVLLDYLRVLDNRRQDISLAAVLRSAFAEMSDEEMAEIRCMYPDKPFFESVAEYRVHGREQKIREKLEKCLGQMDELRLIVPYTPMHELLWKILDRTGYGDYVAAMPGGAQRRANLDMLIEKARAYEATSYKGLFHFVRYIEQLQKYDVDYGEASIEDEYADTVRVMTIHKSKGLEFPVVITAGMGKRFNMQDARSAVALHAGMGVGLDAVDLEYRTKIPSIIKKVIQKEEALESLGEELRVLYVALTRAKEKLIITGTLSKPEDKIAGYQMFGKDTEGTLSFSQLSHASTYWDWILPAVLKCREELFRIQILHIEDVVKESIEEEEKSGLSRTVLENWNVEEIYEPGLHEMMQEQFAFSYPYEKSSERKLKFTVTELKKRAYEIASDEREEEQGECFYEEPEVVPLLPRFMQQEEGLTGAPRGTAYHRVMELLDFAGMQKYGNIQWFDGWLKEQVRHGKLEEEAAGCIRQADILEFLQCNSGKRMQEAARKQKLYREQPFVLGVDAKELYPEEEDGELILIQGIIDAYFEEPDGLVVLDYKTDKVNNGKELAEKYQEQLRYYAKALEQMSGKKVKEKIIYSFTLKKEIYIE